MKLSITIASLLACTSIVRAQPSLTDPTPLAAPAPQPAETATAPLLPNSSPRSPRRAVTLAAAGTAVSIAATGLGLALTLGNHGGGYGETTDFIGVMALVYGPLSLVAMPSFGHLYGEHRFATPGLYVRAGGLAVIAGGLVVELADNIGGAFCIPSEGPCPSGNDRGVFIMGAGGAVMLAGAIYDIATTGSATERYNAKPSSLHLVPTAIRTPNNSTIAGIGIGGTF